MKAAIFTLFSISGLIHIYIFLMESIWWGTSKVNKAFSVAPADAQTLRGFAFNQGYYNLFLAIEIILGLILWSTVSAKVGATLSAFAAASMVGAALVLLYSSPHLMRAALIQAGTAVLGLILLITLYKTQGL